MAAIPSSVRRVSSPSSSSSSSSSSSKSTFLPYSHSYPSSSSSSSSSFCSSWCSTPTQIMIFLCFVPVFLCIVGLPTSSPQSQLRQLRVLFDQEEQDSPTTLFLILKLYSPSLSSPSSSETLVPSPLLPPSPEIPSSPSPSSEETGFEFIYLRRDLDSSEKDLPFDVESSTLIAQSEPFTSSTSSSPSPQAPFVVLRMNAILEPLGGTKVLIRFHNPFAKHKLFVELKFSPLSFTLGEAEDAFILKNPVTNKAVMFNPQPIEGDDSEDNEKKEVRMFRGFLVLNPLEEFEKEVDLRRGFQVDWVKSQKYTVRLDGDFGDHFILPFNPTEEGGGGGGGEGGGGGRSDAEIDEKEREQILRLLRNQTRKERPFQVTSGTITIHYP